MSENTEETKRQAKASCEMDLEREQLTFTFADPAKTVKVFRFADYPEQIQRQLGLHGLEQKLRDCYASKVIDATQAVGVQAKTNDNLLIGLFNAKREAGSGVTVDSIALLNQAIANVCGAIHVAVPAAWQNLDALSKEARAEIRAVDEIAKELAVLRAAKRKSGGTLAEALAKANG